MRKLGWLLAAMSVAALLTSVSVLKSFSSAAPQPGDAEGNANEGDNGPEEVNCAEDDDDDDRDGRDRDDDDDDDPEGRGGGDDGDREGEDGSGAFELLGTSERVEFLGNQVLRVDTFGLTYGGASVEFDDGEKVCEFTRRIFASIYYVNIQCYGGSPRVFLLIDTDGDGEFDQSQGDLAAAGHPDTTPMSPGDCPQQTWLYVDFTAFESRWELLPGAGPCGPGMCTWSALAGYITTTYPNHQVLGGGVVQDAFGPPQMEGIALYDHLQIGDAVLN